MRVLRDMNNISDWENEGGSVEFEKQESGLITPMEAKEVEKSDFGSFELRDKEDRAKAEKALDLLWDACNLSSQCNMANPYWRVYELFYNNVGELLLGEDGLPDREILC